MIFCFHRRHLKAKHPDNYKQYLSSDLQINSTRFLAWNFAFFSKQLFKNWSCDCIFLYCNVMLLLRIVFYILHTARQIFYLLMSWSVGSHSLSWSWASLSWSWSWSWSWASMSWSWSWATLFCLHLGTYLLAPITGIYYLRRTWMRLATTDVYNMEGN